MWIFAAHYGWHFHNLVGLCRSSVQVRCRIVLLDTYVLHEYYYIGHCIFTFTLMCCLKLSCWSRNLPRYLTSLLISIMSPWTLSSSGDIFLSCAWDLKRIYSVFVSVQFKAHCVHPSFYLFECFL